jgi:UDP-glucuronate decarboxylase
MHPNDGRVVSNFVVQTLRNKDITVYGDGTQTRRSGPTEDDVIGPVNLGNPDEFTIRELAEMVIDTTGRPLIIRSSTGPFLRTIPGSASPTSARLKKLLDWRPQVPLQDGRPRTIAYFEHLLAKEAVETLTGHNQGLGAPKNISFPKGFVKNAIIVSRALTTEGNYHACTFNIRHVG